MDDFLHGDLTNLVMPILVVSKLDSVLLVNLMDHKLVIKPAQEDAKVYGQDSVEIIEILVVKENIFYQDFMQQAAVNFSID